MGKTTSNYYVAGNYHRICVYGKVSMKLKNCYAVDLGDTDTRDTFQAQEAGGFIYIITGGKITKENFVVYKLKP